MAKHLASSLTEEKARACRLLMANGHHFFLSVWHVNEGNLNKQHSFFTKRFLPN